MSTKSSKEVKFYPISGKTMTAGVTKSAYMVKKLVMMLHN